jgi:fructose-bisphosphate aldolase class II
VKFVKETKVDALAIAMGTSARRLQVHPQAGRRHAGHERDRGDPPQAAEHASGDARLVVGAAGPAGHHQQVRRRDEADLGRAGREIQRGIKHGVRKINIDTDNRMAMTGQIRKVLSRSPSEFDPRKYLKPAMEAMTKLCKQRFEEFPRATGSRVIA